MAEECITPSKGSQLVPWKPTLTKDKVSAVIAGHYQRYSKRFEEAARSYRGLRADHGLTSEDSFIISPYGLTSNNALHPAVVPGYTYVAPNPGGYKVTPKGVTRPWTYVMLHSFGHAWDLGQLGYTRQKQSNGKYKQALVRNGSLMRAPGDTYGHNPTRFFAGVKSLCGGGARPVGIHFIISRRGDVVVSCDLNDIAKHGYGDAYTMHARGNNYVTVGIELEVALVRLKKNSYPVTNTYSTLQLQALAIILRKIGAYRSISNNVISKERSDSVSSQCQQWSTGYLQHRDVNTKTQRHDAGGEFNILPGQTGTVAGVTQITSGWTTLFGYMAKVRDFDLGTQVFQTGISPLQATQMSELNRAITQANAGQKAPLRKLRGRMASMARAERIRAQSRRGAAAQASGQHIGFAGALKRILGLGARQMAQYTLDTTNNAAITGNIPAYNESSNTWVKDKD
jgi:hypothetical protein